MMNNRTDPQKARYVVIILICGLFSSYLGCSLPRNASSASDLKLKTFQFSQLDSLMRIESRPIAVFLRTDWCKYCKSMEQTTFRDAQIVQQLNHYFYFIPFNAEQKDPIVFKGNTFSYQPKGRNIGTHELALALGGENGKIAYPTFVLLNADYEITFQYGAYLSATEMLSVLEKVVGSQSY